MNKEKNKIEKPDMTPDARDEKFMKEALKQARKAYDLGETPIGCVIVHEGKIIARGYNRRSTDGNVLAHAEISAIRKACRKLGDWRGNHNIYYFRALPDVCGSHSPGPYPPLRYRRHESKGGMCRLRA